VVELAAPGVAVSLGDHHFFYYLGLLDALAKQTYFVSLARPAAFLGTLSDVGLRIIVALHYFGWLEDIVGSGRNEIVGV